MMNGLLVIILALLISQNAFPQYVKIYRILNTNLFELKDSTRIKLAGVDLPGLDHPDYFLRVTAQDAVKYFKQSVMEKKFRLKILDEVQGVKVVYLMRDYPFGDKNYNLEWLERGYGKFINNIDSNDVEEFIKAEQNAKLENKGIWKILADDDTLALDRSYKDSEMNDLDLTDSIEYLIGTTSEPKFIHVAGELILSPIVGFAVGVPLGALSTAIFAAGDHGEWAGFGEFLLGWYAGYLLGSAGCVYAISSKTTKDVKLGYTILASALAGGTGIALAQLSNNRENDWLWFAPLVFPVISSVIYANSAPDRFSTKTAVYDYFNNRNFTAADLYNRSKLFELDLLKISF